MKSKLGDKARLNHILDAIFEINSYVDKVEYEVFSKNSMMQFASIKQLEIIGESANNITKELKQMYNKIKWREIVGFRNLLIHEYFGIDLLIVGELSKKIYQN